MKHGINIIGARILNAQGIEAAGFERRKQRNGDGRLPLPEFCAEMSICSMSFPHNQKNGIIRLHQVQITD